MKKQFLYVSLILEAVTAVSTDGASLFERTSGNETAGAATGCQDGRCPHYSYEELWEFQNHFWDRFQYPANVEEAQSINSTLFAKDIQGRVDITRIFDGQELNTEYLFGLFTDPNSVTLVNTPIGYEITQFAANDYITAASTIVTFTSTLLETQVPVTIDTFIAWDEEGRVKQYDATFKWFDFLLASFIGKVMEKYALKSTEEAVMLLSTVLTKSICEIHDNHCKGENQQFKDSAACAQFLTGGIRFGVGYELGQNTLLCRSIHQQMVQYRPDVHCAHIGPSGGGMCVDDQTYEQKALQEYFTHMPFVVKP